MPVNQGFAVIVENQKDPINSILPKIMMKIKIRGDMSTSSISNRNKIRQSLSRLFWIVILKWHALL